MMRRTLFVALFATACATAPPAAPPADEQARATIQELRNALAEDPADGARIYALAQVLDHTGDTAEALTWLGELDRLGWTHGVNDHDFVHSRNTRTYRAIAARLDAREPHMVRSTTAFTVPQRDLIPEGIAFDPAGTDFYISSIHLRKIVKVNRDGKSSDFTEGGQDGMFGALGLKVDAERRLLWVVSNVNEAMSGFSNALEGQSAVHAYDLRDGRLVTKIVTGGAGDSSLLNDLVILDDGSVLITDTDRGTVMRVRLGSDAIETWLPPNTFTFPNGIAVIEGEPFVYVADFDGLWRVDLRSRSVELLDAPEGEVVSGIDGLASYHGALIGIQNGVGKPRVIRIAINDSRDAITSIDVLEAGNPLFDEPTTGAIAGDALYFMANPQLRAFDENHVIWPWERLHDIIVLKLPLDAMPSAAGPPH